MKLTKALGALLCLAAAQAAFAWEGLVTLKVTAPDKSFRQVNYSVKGDKTLVSLLGGDYGYTIIDTGKKEMITVAVGGKTYSRQPLASAPAMAPGVKVEKKDYSEPIKGHRTANYEVTTNGLLGFAYVLLAEDIPAEFWRLSDGSPWAMALAGKNGMLVRASVYINHKETRIEAVTIQPMRFTADEFEPPADAKEVPAVEIAPVPVFPPAK